MTACSDSDSGSSDESSDGKFDIALIQSYSGNDWQNASANMIVALAASEPYVGKVNFRREIAGADAERQIQLMTQAISAGVDAMVIYPISPTALNQVIREACDAGIIVVAYDSWVEEECAYNVHVNVEKLATIRAEWLAQHLGGEGKIAELLGVAGTTFDTIHQQAVDKALENYPGIEIVAREEAFWSQPGAREAIRAVIAAHPDLDGYIAQVGCWGATEALIEDGREPLPCAGNVSNGHLLQMMPVDQGGLGVPGIGASETTFTGGLAFMQAVALLEGETRCNRTIIDPPVITSEELVFGNDPTVNGTVYPSNNVPTVPDGFFVKFYSPLIGQGLNAALAGIPDQISAPTGPVTLSDGCVVP